MNIRRVAYGLKELGQLRAQCPRSGACEEHGESAPAGVQPKDTGARRAASISREDVEKITRAVLEQMGI